MAAVFLALAGVLAGLNWMATAGKLPARSRTLSKPGTLLALIAWVAVSGGLGGARLFLSLGLCFGLAGDILLMLPERLLPRRLLAGLGAFLLGHVCYIAGLNQSLPPLELAGLALLALLGFTGWSVYRRLAAGMQRTNRQALRVPVLVYTVVSCFMALSALLTLVRPEWQVGAALAVSAGALSFLLSDTLLAWDQFVAPLPNSQLRVMVTYHLAQFLIALAFLLQFPAS